ncbi:MAG: hypothetical protein GEU75_04715 [Dehalococcoidia bacterium]|nr:hypothetical protein [Dehalococcoidia bacterium]
MLKRKTLTLEEAMRVINAVIDHAKKSNHIGIATVIVNPHGEIIASAKMDGRSPRFYKAAHRKAYSAAKFERDTSAIIDLHAASEAEGRKGPHDWNDSMLSTLPGGYLVVDEEENILGAVSVAGGTGGEFSDWNFIKIGFAALGDGYHHRPGMGEH